MHPISPDTIHAGVQGTYADHCGARPKGVISGGDQDRWNKEDVDVLLSYGRGHYSLPCVYLHFVLSNS